MKNTFNVFLLPILISTNCLGAAEDDDQAWIRKVFGLREAREEKNKGPHSPTIQDFQAPGAFPKHFKTDQDNPEKPNCSLYGSCKSPTTTMKTPMLQVSFNLRELIERCASAECRINDEMRIREPFYVEEPGWIQINKYYPDEFARRFGKNDPFFGTRGKKNSGSKYKEVRQKDSSLRFYRDESPKDVLRELMKGSIAVPEESRRN